MSFIQRFLERVLRTNTTRMPRTSFDDLNQDQLDAHLRVGRYGGFSLTDAIRPSYGLEVIPREGYRRDVYRDPETGNTMPVLAASYLVNSTLTFNFGATDALSGLATMKATFNGSPIVSGTSSAATYQRSPTCQRRQRLSSSFKPAIPCVLLATMIAASSEPNGNRNGKSGQIADRA